MSQEEADDVAIRDGDGDGLLDLPRRRSRRTIKEKALDASESPLLKLAARLQMTLFLPLAGLVLWGAGQVWDEAIAYAKEVSTEIADLNDKLHQINLNQAREEAERDDQKRRLDAHDTIFDRICSRSKLCGQ